MRIYTRRGDSGQTGLFLGGRTWKDAPGPEAYGAVDEAVAALGVARTLADPAMAERILDCQRDLFIVAADLAAAPDKRHQLQPGVSATTPEMAAELEPRIDELVAAHGLPTEFVVPGENPLAAALDVARTAVRRAERRAVSLARASGADLGAALAYLNRLADYVYVMARFAAGDWEPSRPSETQ